MEQERNELQSGNATNAGKVFVFSCPYLGTLEDSETSLAYPATANHCFRVESPAAVDLSHQETYCLTDKHPGCHVFQKAIIAFDLQESEETDYEPEDEQKRRVSLYALPLILILILLAAIVWWPAPGSDLQEALVFGNQVQEGTIEDTSLTSEIAAESLTGANRAETDSSPAIEATAPAVSLRGTSTEEEAAKASSTNESNSDTRSSSPQSQVCSLH